MKCFKVKVKTTNCSYNTFDLNQSEDMDTPPEYYDCKDGEIYVVAKDIALVADKYKKCAIEITEIGFGYVYSILS